MSSLAIDNVSAGYGGTDVLRDVSVSVSPGQCVAVLGPNGAGKSTLLRVLSGQLRIRSGTRTIAGEEVRSWSAHQAARSGVRWVGEPRPIFPGLSVAENLELGGIMARKDISEQRERVYALLPALYEKRTHRAASLSGGQQQLLGIGQALMSKPRFLCLDEPSLGLSPAMVSVMTQLITNLVDEGVGIAWAEQFPEVAKAHCSELIVLSAGVVAMSGDPHLVTSADLTDAYLGGTRPQNRLEDDPSTAAAGKPVP